MIMDFVRESNADAGEQAHGSDLSCGSSDRACSRQSSCSTSGRSSEELSRILQRFGNAVVRGAAIGFTLRGGLHVLGAVLASFSKRKKRTVGVAGALEDTLRYTAFLATLASVYIGVDEGIAAGFGKQR